MPPYYDEPVYIEALAASIEAELRRLPFAPELILASFHGIPKSYVDEGDPYPTPLRGDGAAAARAASKLDESKLMLTFQSRFGRAEWLQPYTDKTVEALARRGVKNLAVVTPGFSADCLETLEEIAVENADIFQANGGENFAAIPCLNDSEAGMAVISASGAARAARLDLRRYGMHARACCRVGCWSLRVAAVTCGRSPALAQDGAWTMKKPLPAPRNEVALAAVGGKVYVVGGSVGGEAVPLIDEYDPASDRGARCAPMPKGLDHLGVAVVGGKIITVGGFIGSVHRGAVSDVYEYDPAADTWRALAPMKNAARLGRRHRARRQGPRRRRPRRRQHVHRRHPRGVRSGDRAMERARAVAAAARPPGAGRGSTASSMPSAAASPIRRAASHPRHLRSEDQFLVVRSAAADRAQRAGLCALPGHDRGARAASLPPDTFPNNEAYDPKSNAWRTLAPMPHGRHGTGAAVIGKNLYVAAGSLKPGSGEVTDQLIVFTMP